MTTKHHTPKDEAPQDDLEVIAQNAGRYARKMLDESQHLGEGAESVLAAIREEPIKTALIALGVGAVIGFLIRR